MNLLRVLSVRARQVRDLASVILTCLQQPGRFPGPNLTSAEYGSISVALEYSERR